MIRTSFIILILSCLVGYQSLAQNLFENTYGNNDQETGRSVLQTADKGFIMVGHTNSFGGDEDIYLIKTDSAGILEWAKTLGTSAEDKGYEVIIVSDGYVIAASTDGTGPALLNAYLIKTDFGGIQMWAKTFGGSADDMAYAVDATDDGGYILVGESSSFGNAKQLYVIRTDSLGTLIWDTVYGGTGDEQAVSVRQTLDGGFAIFGYTTSIGAGNADMHLLKINGNKSFMWEKTWGNNNQDFGYHLEQAADSGYFLLGVNQTALDTNKLSLIRTDKSGNQIWFKYPFRIFSDRAYHFQITADSNLAIGGYTNVTGFSTQYLLIKADANGDTLWTKHYGGSQKDHAFAIATTTDKGYAMLGQTEGFGSFNIDYYLVKLDSMGNVACPGPGTFDAPDVCINTNAVFTNTTISSNPFSWIVDDTIFYSGINSSHFFDSIGSHKVQMIQCTDTAIQTIEVFPLPIVAFTCTYDPFGYTATFTMDTSLNPASFSWDFGDGSAKNTSNQNPTHIYANKGTYNIKLVITDMNGCTDSIVKQITLLFNSINNIWIGGGEIAIYPNPVSINSTLFIDITAGAPFVKQIEVYDVSGKIVIKRFDKLGLRELSMNGVKPGIYFYLLTDKDSILYRGKLVVMGN
ncbi:MAG: PKD domain-containing protein [Bacteroidetes bacterium]|nr:PKD domain-containing protein [Bacteroidota bacterium]